MRFSETETTNSSQMDFVPRERRSQILNLIFAFVVVMALIFIFVLTFPPSRREIAAMMSMGVVAVLCIYVVYRKQQSLDLVMSTEYQNLLFSQAASLGSSFCLFVRRDGTIVYANDGLRKMFPNIRHGSSQALLGIFEAGKIQKTDQERVLEAIYASRNERLVFPIFNGGFEKTYILTIEPLKRPAGFSVIRGREYHDERVGTEIMPDVLRSTSMEKLNHLLANTPVAHYTTDAYGRIEYVTPAFEQLLGYAPNEIVEQRLEIWTLLKNLGGLPIPEVRTLTKYEGQATLNRKDGSALPCLIFQQLMADEQGRTTGGSGSILPSGKP